MSKFKNFIVYVFSFMLIYSFVCAIGKLGKRLQYPYIYEDIARATISEVVKSSCLK